MTRDLSALTTNMAPVVLLERSQAAPAILGERSARAKGGILKFLIALTLGLLGLTANVQGQISDSQVFKARIVDSHGKVRGYRGIRDLELCGKNIGPALLAEGPLLSTETLRIDCTSDHQNFFQNGRFAAQEPLDSWPGAEVRTLISQGPVENRIDLTIVGDGYTEAEKAKFFDDAQKITDDLFGQDTFATYRPLFNVHAVFVPSNTSGIGDGSPKDTALGLYRHPTVRQAVICDNEWSADRASRLAPDVDYPILVGNDAFYGGLGGQFAITTSAPLNITTVLRHELGHNFGNVGEEYDGGQVYSGANFSRSRAVSWQHHIQGEVQVHKMDLVHYSAPWRDITSSDFEQVFRIRSDARVLFDFSSLGFDTKEDVQVYIDDVLTNYDGRYNYDRNFYLIEKQLTAGRHSIRFHRVANDRNNIVSKLAIYTVPDSFPVGSNLIGAFATYDGSGDMVGYRPTDRVCLMKDMQSTKFCNVCLENMWRLFLKQISLIDSVVVNGYSVTAGFAPVGSQRLHIEWVDPQGKLREDLTNKTYWEGTVTDKGRWTLRVRFISPEVIDPNQDAYTVHTKTFTL